MVKRSDCSAFLQMHPRGQVLARFLRSGSLAPGKCVRNWGEERERPRHADASQNSRDDLLADVGIGVFLAGEVGLP